MASLELFLQVVFLVTSPILHLALGQLVVKLVFDANDKRTPGQKRAGVVDKAARAIRGLLPELSDKDRRNLALPCYALGLLLYLSAALAFRLLSAPWFVAAFAPFLPLLASLREISCALHRLKPSMNVHAALWFSVVFALGATLFSATDRISTPWPRNQAALAFHLSRISALVFGGNSLPQIDAHAAPAFSYPVFVDLWTACYWWIHPSFKSLWMIFVFQWMAAWTVAYYALNGDRWKWPPWLLLFGGGAYDLIFQSLSGGFSGEALFKPAFAHLEQGYPWQPFLSFLWVAQRPVLLGLIAILPALNLFHSYLEEEQSARKTFILHAKLVVASLILALSPLTHTQFFFIALLYICSILCLRMIGEIFRPSRLFRPANPSAAQLLPRLTDMLSVLFVVLPSTLLFAHHLGQLSSFGMQSGWMPWPPPPAGNTPAAIINTAGMWLNNAPLWLLLLLVMWYVWRSWLSLSAIILLFLGANCLYPSPGQQSHLSAFVALFAATLSLLSSLERKYFSRGRWLLVLLILPGVFDLWQTLLTYTEHTVYSSEQLQAAIDCRKSTKNRQPE